MSQGHNLSGPGGFKEEPSDPHHPHHSQQVPTPSQHLQGSRSSSIVQQHAHNSPHPPQSQHQAAYASPHSSTHGLPQVHSSFTSSSSGPNPQHPQEIPYFAQHPTSYNGPGGPGSYSSAEQSDLMAAAHMSRPYPPIYHTPQSNSPASVASPTAHDAHRQSLYGQPPPQLPQGMYGYAQYSPMPQAPPSYGHQAGSQHPSMTSQPLLVSHPGSMQQAHPQSQAINTSPQSKLAQTPLQRPPPSQMGGAVQNPVAGPPQGMNSNMPPNMQGGGQGGNAANPNAAPGPIPATTPLVVRQDNNGVQWIAFEYSRDRVKMEYTIRCDVESVITESLSQEFKTENCVYPRACCTKDQYRGNRLNYESECNTVGWALAELNPCLRGKRGLIQRAVDSWRNSNQDPKLRSRRVRRMAKIHNRKSVAATQQQQQQQHQQHQQQAQQQQQQVHMAGPVGPSPVGIPTSAGMMPASSRKTSMGMAGPGQMHHHHAQSDGSGPGGPEDVSAQSAYNDGAHHHHQPPNGTTSASNDRPSHVFHGYAAYPTNANVGSSMAPSVHDPMTGMGGHPGQNPTAIATSAPKASSTEDIASALYGDLPKASRRKFILVDDPHRGARVRVRVMLDTVNMNEIPDSYRKTNSVFPRSYYPVQMQSPPHSLDGKTFVDDEDDETEDSARPGRGRTFIPIPLLDGTESEFALPSMGRKRRSKEMFLNDLGYRMSWSQSRVFAGRTMFLQRSLDAYRNKMRSTMIAAGSDVQATAPNFETRVGKRKWLDRSKRLRERRSLTTTSSSPSLSSGGHGSSAGIITNTGSADGAANSSPTLLDRSVAGAAGGGSVIELGPDDEEDDEETSVLGI